MTSDMSDPSDTSDTSDMSDTSDTSYIHPPHQPYAPNACHVLPRRATVDGGWRRALSLALRAGVGAAVALLLPAIAAAQLRYTDVQKLAREAVRNRELSIEPSSMRIEEGFLYYKLGGGRIVEPTFEANSALLTVIEAQIQVEVIRQTRTRDPLNKILTPVLPRVEEAIAGQLGVAQDQKLSAEDRDNRLWEWSEKIGKIYEDAMKAYAAKRGVELGMAAEYRAPFSVKLVTSPPGGRIFLTHAIQMRVAELRGKDPDWRLIEDPTSVELEGKYYYLIQWGDRTQKSERPIQVDRNGTFVLR